MRLREQLYACFSLLIVFFPLASIEMHQFLHHLNFPLHFFFVVFARIGFPYENAC